MYGDMLEADIYSYRRKRLPLAFRLSLILMLIAVLPPLLIVGISEYTARPILINQANQTMEADAEARTQLIDAYLQDRISDLVTVSTTQALQTWITEGLVGRQQNNDEQTGLGVLNGGETHDPNYMKWSVTDVTDGNQPVIYPTNATMAPQEVAFQSQLLGPLMQRNPLPTNLNPPAALARSIIISPVYSNPATHNAFIDIYMPVFQFDRTGAITDSLGYLMAQLSLNHIWDIVDGDKGIANSGNSFILDNNGVRIADSSNHNLFTAVAPLHPEVQQLAVQQEWYGTNQGPKVQANTALEAAINHPRQHLTFPMTPYGQTQPYQAALSQSTVLPWTYVVTSPSSVVTQAADQQLLTTIAGAILLLVLAALIGLLTSSRISRPIMRSVAQLRGNSEALNGLAQKQQGASSEQLWVIDSVKVGLQSVQYYTDATRISAHKMSEIGTELRDSWLRQDIETIRRSLQEVIDVAQYIEKAADYQTDSSQKLTTAIKVTSQVNDQLADGSISATEAAKQLQQVVNDLRNVVGQ